MNAKWMAVALVAAMLAAGGPAHSQTSQPDVQVAAATTQPDELDGPLPLPLPQSKPQVSGVGPVVPGEGPRENELAPPPPQEPAQGGAQPGTPPPQPTPEDLIRDLPKGEAGLTAQPGAPRADEVADSLAPDRRTVALEPTQPTAESAVVPLESVRPDARQKLLPEGYAVRDSVGYLVRDQARWLFTFQADSSAGTDPPLILLPNSLLETMISQSQSGQAKIRFRVTGEVTQFRQTNYLLLRKVLIEHNLDRF